MLDNKIHVVLAIYDPRGTYSCHAGVVLASMFSNTKSPVCVHILHDETISGDNRKKFIELAEEFGQEVNFVNVGEHIEKLHVDVDKLTRGFSRGSLFRLFIHELLPIDKVIYLDCDVIVEIDIKELWDSDLGDCKVGVVLDIITRNADSNSRKRFFCRYVGIDAEKYFNSGVMVLNLKKIRGNLNIYAEALKFFERYPDTLLPDQDFLNKIFQKSAKELELKFNCPGSEINHLDVNDKLYHCVGKKPWDVVTGLPTDALYWQYLAKTPWCRDLALDMTEAWAKSRFSHIHSSDCIKTLWKKMKENFSPKNATSLYKIAVIWHDISYRIRKKF